MIKRWYLGYVIAACNQVQLLVACHSLPDEDDRNNKISNTTLLKNTRERRSKEPVCCVKINVQVTAFPVNPAASTTKKCTYNDTDYSFKVQRLVKLQGL